MNEGDNAIRARLTLRPSNHPDRPRGLDANRHGLRRNRRLADGTEAKGGLLRYKSERAHGKVTPRPTSTGSESTVDVPPPSRT